MALALLPNFFSLTYDPSSGILAGGWSVPVPMSELSACYEALLAAAQAHGNSHFWLLDLRQRNWHTPELACWFATDFAPRAAAALGQPLFIAYLVASAQQPFIESEATDSLLRRAAGSNCYPFYFENELAARAWLHDQREAELRSRPRSAAAWR